MQNFLKCGVIGTGYLGRFHAQKYNILQNVKLIGVYDRNLDVAENVANELGVQRFDNLDDLLAKIDAVSIAASTKQHFEITKKCLLKGKHVLLEKPMTETVAQADELIKLAKKHHVTLQIGHLERFNPVFIGLTKLQLNPKSIECKRLAPFNHRGSDVNVILDVMIHDLDWILQIMQQPVIAIEAKGSAVMTQDIDIANVRLTFANGNIATITASRIHKTAERSALIIDDNRYIQADFLKKTIQCFKKSNTEILPGVQDLEHNELSFANEDALLNEIQAFTNSILTNKQPVVTALEGRDALKLALDITAIIKIPETQYEPL